VAATSSTNAWAVGACAHRLHIGTYLAFQAVIEHWNGKAWKIQQTPSSVAAGDDVGLDGVAAVSSRHAWAVGCCASNGQALILRWNGKG
jgi:hypothetical protein